MTALFNYRDEDLYSHHTIDYCPDSDQFAMHAHEWSEILFLISGKGNYLVEGVSYPLQPGDIFILRPGEMHKLNIDSACPYERIVIHFSSRLLTSVDPELNLLRPFYERPLGRHNRYSSAEDSEGLLKAAFADFSFEHVPNARLNLLARLLLFLTSLDGIYDRSRTHLPAQGFQTHLVDYVNEHLFENISVQSIADRFYRSRSQISRSFHQATGTTLWEYVTIKRLMAARARIQRGEQALSACSACGFSEYSSFYRAYKKHFGHSPREDGPK